MIESSSATLAPECVVAVLEVLDAIECGEEDPLELVRANRGLGICAAYAARSAARRSGSVWSVVRGIARFLEGDADHIAQRAQRMIVAAAAGTVAVSIDEDDQQIFTFDGSTLDELKELASSRSPLVQCAVKCAELACWVADSRNTDAPRYTLVTEDAHDIAHLLATEVSESAAREFVASIEAL